MVVGPTAGAYYDKIYYPTLYNDIFPYIVGARGREYILSQ